MESPRLGGGTSFDRTPSMKRSPPVISSSPAMSLNRVDLPQPDGPTKTQNSRSSIPSDTPLMMSTSPKDFLMLVSLTVAIARCPPYFTAPKVRPRTSCRWLIQPKMRMGAMAMVDAAESLAQKSPSGLENEAMNAVRGAALAAVRLRLQKASFQDKMMASSEVEAMPGSESGSSRWRSSSLGCAPSMRPASRIPRGTSLQNEDSIQQTMGRLTSVYTIRSPTLVSRIPTSRKIR